MFALHPQLAADSAPVLCLELCEVRMILDANYPWFVLVPQREAIREIHNLTKADQDLLTAEIAFVSEKLQQHYQADKMNVAALGNMVPQLHVHVAARFETDAAWPGAIWGAAEPRPYADTERERVVREIADLLTTP